MTGPRRDPYVILGVSRAAGRDQIAVAYRRLAKAIHPDLGTESESDMRDLNWAWHVLSDHGRRTEWDAAHPTSGGHWRAAGPEAATWRPAEEADMAAAVWFSGGGWSDAADLPDRRSAFGCIGVMVLMVLVAGLILIAALYPDVPDLFTDPAEVQESSAP
ncbi:MAG TPA: DnaJ domain-containing protein [Candidatus Limnocylindria bacterium]